MDQTDCVTIYTYKIKFVLTILLYLCSEAGCTPFATSIIADYFVESIRGSALGIYNWGIYIGYSLSYALGNFITDADINGRVGRYQVLNLKEYYEIVDEARPLSGFFPTQADFFTEMHF